LIENRRVQYLIVILLFIAVNLISFFTQQRINVNDGKGWDGVEYFEIAKEISEGKVITGPAPLVYRVGTPFLASVINKNDLLNGFFIANLAANFLSLLLTFAYLKIYLKNFYVIIALVIFYLFHWMCNTRFIYYYPSITDPWGLTFLLSGLVLIEKYRRDKSNICILFLCLISFTGVLFREFVIIIPIAFLFVNNPFDKRDLFFTNLRKLFFEDKIKFLPLVAGTAGVLLTRLFTENTGTDYSFLKTVIYFIYNKSLTQYIHAWFFAVGPAIALLVYFYKDVFRFAFENQYMLILLTGAFVLSFTGGSDTGRLILWFIPLILLFEGKVIEENIHIFSKPFLIICLIVFQIFSMKAIITIPQPIMNPDIASPPSITQMKDVDLSNIISSIRNLDPLLLSFLKYFLAAGFLMAMLRYYSWKQRKVV